MRLSRRYIVNIYSIIFLSRKFRASKQRCRNLSEWPKKRKLILLKRNVTCFLHIATRVMTVSVHMSKRRRRNDWASAKGKSMCQLDQTWRRKVGRWKCSRGRLRELQPGGLVVWDGRGPRSGEPAGELSLAVIQPLTHISGVQVALCFTYIGVDAIAKMSTKNRLVILFEDVNYYRGSQERENDTSRFIRQQQQNWASSSVYYRVRDGTGDFGRHFGGFTCRQPTVVQCIFMRFSRLDRSHT